MKRSMFVLFLVILIGCTSAELKKGNTQIANPASVYCEEQGGILEITTAVDGSQSGICTLKNGTKCDEWAYYRNECPAKEEAKPIAEETKTPENPLDAICNLLPLSDKLSPGDKWFCLAVINHNPALCKEMTSIIEINDNEGMNEEGDEEDETNKNICFAVVNADSSYCKNLPDQHAKKTCYYQSAVMNNNIAFCDEIDYDKNERLQCYFNFVINLYWWDRSNEIKEEYCDRFPANEPDKNTCLAFKDRDVSLCKSNVNCLTFFKQDMSFCSGRGSVLKDCVRDRAMTDKDVSICETLTGAQRDDCLGDFCTHIRLDKTICDKIVDDMERQSRYSEIAIHLSNNVRND